MLLRVTDYRQDDVFEEGRGKEGRRGEAVQVEGGREVSRERRIVG